MVDSGTYSALRQQICAFKKQHSTPVTETIDNLRHHVILSAQVPAVAITGMDLKREREKDAAATVFCTQY